jgi:hypothetical protein
MVEATTQHSYAVHTYINNCLEPYCYAQVKNLNTPYEVIQRLTQLYGNLSKQAFHTLWKKLTNLKYKQDGDQNIFLQKWKDIIIEMANMNYSIPQYIEKELIIQAISNMKMDSFITQIVSPHFKWTLEQIHSQFLQNEFARKAQNQYERQTNETFSTNATHGGKNNDSKSNQFKRT